MWLTESEFRRFASKVAAPTTPNDCLEWVGGKQRQGYGTFRLRGSSHLAHRVSYRNWVGSVPEGLVLDHLCRNRACVNPTHLEPKTVGDNNRAPGSLIGEYNRIKTHCNRGHELVGPNLSPSGVRVGKRICLACQRALVARHNARVRGRFWSDEETRESADRYHRAIEGVTE